jgi:formylglycine-generating enzyme required for sulfatase activity
MVEIPMSATVFYCIDRAEVKNVEYQAFVDAQSGTGGQTTACAFNTSYLPAMGNGCDQYDPVNSPKLPVACIDWCDAAAYCKWEGKHLCGKIGGGSNAPASFADANQSAWYRACSKAGTLDFPYGNTFNGSSCIGLENTAIHPVSVPNFDCEGGYAGLYDMSGNVSEWEDSCSADKGGTDQCLYRGGSYLDTNKTVGASPSLLCNSNLHGSPLAATKARSTRDKEIGFRCCGEPVATP